MGIGTSLAIYFVIWWITLFAVLPFGVKSQAEAGTVTEGTEPAAPVSPLMLKKLVATTVVAAVVFGLFYWVRAAGWTIDDFPFGPR